MVIRFDSKLTLQNGGSNTLNTKAASPALSLKIGDTLKNFSTSSKIADSSAVTGKKKTTKAKTNTTDTNDKSTIKNENKAKAYFEEKAKEAQKHIQQQEKLYAYRSSKKAKNGMTYQKAEQIISEIYEQYSGKEKYLSSQDHVFHSEKYGDVVIGQDIYLDESKLPERAKKMLAAARKAQAELEERYPGIGDSAIAHNFHENAKNMTFIG